MQRRQGRAAGMRRERPLWVRSCVRAARRLRVWGALPAGSGTGSGASGGFLCACVRMGTGSCGRSRVCSVRGALELALGGIRAPSCGRVGCSGCGVPCSEAALSRLVLVAAQQGHGCKCGCEGCVSVADGESKPWTVAQAGQSKATPCRSLC